MEKLKRVAFLSEHASPVALLGGEDAGGQNVYVDEVSRNLAQLGYAVDVFTRRDTRNAAEIIVWAPNVRIINLSAGPATFLAKDDLWEFMPAFRDAFLDFLERNEVYYDLIHSNFWMSGWVATELQSRLNVPAVQIFHALGKTKQRHQGSADTSPRERIAIESQIIQSIEGIIAQCPNEWSELVDDYSANPSKIALIPAAVNLRVFHSVPMAQARQHIGIAHDAFVIAYVGRILPRKDVRNVVRALGLLVQRRQQAIMKLPAVHLVVVGGGTVEPDPVATPEIGVLQQLVAELGLAEYVSFVGKRQQDTLYNYYSAANVVVTTPWYEPFGLTPLEGMACGRPVIGSAVGGITYTIADGKTGFLVPPRDPEALADRLFQLLNEPELGERMGQVARERVEHEFTWETVASRTACLYETVLATRKVASPVIANEGRPMLRGE